MKTFLILTLFSLLTIVGCTNLPVESRNNLDFENIDGNSKKPVGWIKWGMPEYETTIDSISVSGKTSGLIYPKVEKGNSFGCLAYKLPANFEGNKITLKGYIKTENVEDGYAGLLLRVDGKGNTLAFDNMNNRGVVGTNGWTEYITELAFSPKAERIYVGGILVGKGKAWFDHFQVFIDDVNIDLLEPIEREIPLAEKDTEFDHGSDIQIEQLNDFQIQGLHRLCKIWGFVKYHHPNVALGNINFDYELFRILPGILAVKSNEKLDDLLTGWINSLGEIEKENSLAESQNQKVKLNPEIQWIYDNSYLNGNLSRTLIELRKAKRPFSNHYVSLNNGVNNPNFENERAYPNMKYDDDGFKLLSLFRYWNIINYYFPYRYLIDHDWNSVLMDFIPRMVEGDDELSYNLLLLELVGKVQDTHANVRSKILATEFWGIKSPPVKVCWVEDQVIVKDITASAVGELKKGDVIKSINGVDVLKLMGQKRKYIPASNQIRQNSDLCKKLLRTDKDWIELKLVREGEEFNTKLECKRPNSFQFKTNSQVSHRLISGNIGYIYPGKLRKNQIHDIMNEFSETKGLIVDLRCYPSDFIVFSLGEYLMPEPTEFVQFTTGSILWPGKFEFGKMLKVGKKNKKYYKGKVIILINETTLSQAEYTTMALRVAPNAIVVGSTTAAADGNVSRIVFPGNIQTAITGIGVYYPDGSETQRIGIIPDIELKPTIKGIMENRDELLEKAIKLINL